MNYRTPALSLIAISISGALTPDAFAERVVIQEPVITVQLLTCPPKDPLQACSSQAVPRSDAKTWIAKEDYPSRAQKENRGGVVYFRLLADQVTGKIAECKIVVSSLHPDLDDATCRNLIRRGRFNPVPANEYRRAVDGRVIWVPRWALGDHSVEPVH